MKKMKVEENGRILYKMDREKLEERIKEMELGSLTQFSTYIGRANNYFTCLFKRRDGYCAEKVLEFVARQLKLPDYWWLVEDEVEEEKVEEVEEEPKEVEEETPKVVDYTKDFEELKELLKNVDSKIDNLKPKKQEIDLKQEGLFIKLLAEPNTRVYYLDYIPNRNRYIIRTGSICGYFISAKMAISYKVFTDSAKTVDVKEDKIFLTLKEAEENKEKINSL